MPLPHPLPAGPLTLRDHLALERTRLANERTLLSFVRTGLYLMLGGFAFLQMRQLAHVTEIGYVLFTLSGLSFATGTVRYLTLRARLRRHARPAATSPGPPPAAR